MDANFASIFRRFSAFLSGNGEAVNKGPTRFLRWWGAKLLPIRLLDMRPQG